MQLEAILREGVARNASDVHLKFGSHPIFRVTGNLIPWDEAPRLDRDTMAVLIQELLGDYHCQQLKQGLLIWMLTTPRRHGRVSSGGELLPFAPGL